MEGHEGAASNIFEVANLPVIQDNSSFRVQANWGAMWRDFVILGGSNEEADRYNFEIDSLEIDENREMVKAALVAAAEAAR
jgi:hypothetical protein